MKTGLFFGSFNPVHTGHMIIANYLLSHSDLDALWMVVTPQNPLKDKKSLANNYDRLHLVNLAIGEQSNISSSKVEFNLPIPSYTIDTLDHLKEMYPQKEFVLIMGGDSLASLPKWKKYERILEENEIYVYQRPSYDLGPLKDHKQVKIFDAPLLAISASYVRQEIRANRSVRYLVPDAVFKYISESTLYQVKKTNLKDEDK